MMKRLRYAMVGGSKGSFIGPVHRMAIRMDNLADLVAGAFSRDPKKNAETAGELGLSAEHVHPDWTSLLAAEKDNIDFLSVCTPNDSHYEIAKAALEAGLDVMCEKPLSMTVAEAEELGRLARRKRRILGIPFSYSGMPMVKFARELVAQGEIGKVCKIVLEYNQGSFRKIDLTKPLDVRNAWKMDPRRSGPSCAVADIGVHAFHMLEYVTGLEVKEVLAENDRVAAVAAKYAEADDMFFLGRGILYPTALEGALKMKEVSYLHAEGYQAAELKHGPIALLDGRTPVVALLNDIPGVEKTIGNVQECRARQAPVVGVVTRGDSAASAHCNDTIVVPPVSPVCAPVVSAVALQLFAYHVARIRGCEIDQPRNLAKSVTVE